MKLSMNTRLKTVCAHPIGRDILNRLLLSLGLDKKLLDNPLTGNLTLKSLSKITGKMLDADFFNVFLNLLNSEKDVPLTGAGSISHKWWKEAVFYQIYPRSFCDSNQDGVGDLKGITGKLDYLKELGVDVLWLSPIYKSPNCDNGYDISDYQDIMDDFGTMEDFDEMLEEAHKRGLKIIMDLVVNHTSDEHKWFQESCKAEENPYQDYYIWKSPKEGKEPTNWEASFGGSAWEYKESRGKYYLHSFAVKQPDLNWDNPAVRREVYDMMNWWCEKGIDGFRMDVISMISKPEEYRDGEVQEGHRYAQIGPIITHGPREHEYLKEMNREVLSKYPLMTVGETACVTVEEAKKYAGFQENELNMVFQFEHMDLDFGKYGKWNDQPPKLTELKKVLSKWQTQLYGKAWNSLYWDNHDQPRVVSRFGNDGKYRVESAKMLATCLHMMQGTPYIYQGEELGMTNAGFTSISQYRDIESINAYEEMVESGIYDEEYMMKCLRYKSRDNARTPMQWSMEKNAGFSGAEPWIEVNPNYITINAEEQLGNQDSVFHYYQKLIRLRKKHPVIIEGKYQLLLPDSEELYVYMRIMEAEKMLVVCNFTDQEQAYAVPDEFAGAGCLIGNYGSEERAGRVMLKPYEAFVLHKI